MAPPTAAFFSSFEADDPRPHTTPADDGTPADADGMRCVVDNGPSRSPTAKTGVGFTGVRALRFSGRHLGRGGAAFSHVLFDVDIEVTADTELSYVIFPTFTPGDLTYPSTFTAVDLRFADGTHLSDLDATDQHGAPMTARGQGDSKTLSVDQWNHKSVRIGAITAARRISAILLRYDNPLSPAAFAGWVDDIRLAERPESASQRRPSDYVLTTRGTHSSGEFSRGNNIPATAVPHGFNFWVPVTDAGSTTWLYEYHRANNADNRTELQAFALSHQTSPWMGDRQTFQVLPSDQDGTPDGDRIARALAFGHDAEVARPHHYAVTFDNGIVTEIAPTDHAAMFRFRFTGDTGTLLFDNVNAQAGLTIDAERGVVTGWSDVRSRLSNGASRMFVHATFDKPVIESGQPTGVDDRGEAAGFVRFDTSGADKSVGMRIATSLISLAQAQANLAAEIGPHDSFDDVRDRAQRQWDDTLSLIEVEGASHDQLVTLYSNLYRLFLYPNSGYENVGTASEPRYVHAVQSSVTTPASTPTTTGARVEPGIVYVNNGFWDTYRTTWPAYALLTPARAGELVDGFLQQYRDGGWVSRWSSPGYANLMVGTSSDVAFADAHGKGVTGFDPEEAYDAAVKNATVQPPDDHVGRKGIETSIFLGYTAVESTAEAMSWAMDGYINDFGIAMMAKTLADNATDDKRRARYVDEHVYFRSRALNYVHLFDPSVGFFQGRHADGTWRRSPADFDPREWGFDYTETNAWNMAFHVPHDGQGLAWLYGGRDRLAAKLDASFATPETGDAAHKGSYGTVIHEMTEARDVRMGMYGHSNQPAHHIAYMYSDAGRPDRTQAVVREVLTRLYLGSEIGQGYPGDEDNGEMSAWWVLSALGLYPLRMGSPYYAVGSPLFTKATVHLSNGRDLVIEAPGNTSRTPYVQTLTIDGKPYDKTYLPHDLLAKGAVLAFEMGPEPSEWGTRPESLPPSLTPRDGSPAPLADVTGPDRGTAAASEGVDAALLFDDTAATQASWDADSGWVRYDLQSPHLVELYTLTSGPDDGDPSSWVLSGSVDGVRWDVLDERSGATFRWRRQTRPFGVARPARYAHYRLDWRADAGGPVSLAQIELLGPPPS